MKVKFTQEDLDRVVKDPTDYSHGYYLGNPNIKRAGFETQWTRELLDEYLLCRDNIEYFARKYVTIINLKKGKMKIEPYEYQIKMWEQFKNERFNIVLAARQSGKSIAYVVYVLHKAIFTKDHNFAILANKGATAREILSRVQLALENLPFFLQPGCKTYNKGRIEFDTDTRIFAASTSNDSIRGYSINTLLLDEFAFVENDVTFMASTYPVISSSDTSQIIIVSTANGIGNTFHNIWEKANTGENEYKPIRVDWWDVPGRDDKWKDQTIKNTSERQFAQEFGNNFLSTSNTLVSAEKMMSFPKARPFMVREDGFLKVYEEPIEGRKYVLCADTSRGRGQDYSTFSIFDCTQMPYKQICTYRNNEISPLIFPSIIYKYGMLYNEAMLLVESNDQGIVVANQLYYDLEYPNMFVSSAVKKNGIGVEVTKKVKAIGCMTCKDLIEENKLIPQDTDSILEFFTFCVDGATWNAMSGHHDDMVQNFWLLSWFVKTNYFSEYISNTDNLAKMIFGERIDAIAADLPSFGIIDRGGEDANLHKNYTNDEVAWAKQMGWALTG